MPSITSMLSATTPLEKVESLKNWREAVGDEEANRVSNYAKQHGTNLHFLVEKYLKNEVLSKEDIQNISSADVSSFNALKMYLKKISNIYGQEEAVYSRELNIAGRFDCIAEYKNVPSIIDFKTSRKTKNVHDIDDYKVQLAFYSLAHNEMFQTNISQGIILMITYNGTPIEFKINLEPQYEILKNRVSDFYETLK
jgi:genome maintenance exonuclease 1